MILNKHTTLALLMLIALALQPLSAMAERADISVKLDSARVMMGKTLKLHISIKQDKGLTGRLAGLEADTLTSVIEIANKGKNDTTASDNGHIQINRDVTLQAFDPGTYQLPAIIYIVGGDTIKSKQLSLTVDSIQVDTEGNIKDYKPIIEEPFRLLDIIPNAVSNYWWAWLIGALLIAAAVFSYFKWLKKGINPLKPVKKRLPPYEEAMLALDKLKRSNLWQNGQEKEYYTQLTDILRNYIDRRFGINAIEMTSSEIMERIKKNKDAHIVNDQLNNVLEIADFVKFANMHTLADDNEISFQRALNFVELTKPKPELDENKGKEEEAK